MSDLTAAKAARLRHALTAGPSELYPLLQDTDPDILKSVLRNPQLAEEHLLALLKRPALPEELFKAIRKFPALGGSRRLKIALARHPDLPAPLLAALIPELFLFELVDLLHTAGAPADLQVACERALLKRLPETPLGNRITLARRGSPAILEALLKTGEPRLVEAVLANPKLKEAGVHAFLASATATAETISAVARHPRWGSRPNLRLALLKNPRTPAVWFTLLLPSLPQPQLEGLLVSRSLAPRQLAAVRHEYETRRRSRR